MRVALAVIAVALGAWGGLVAGGCRLPVNDCRCPPVVPVALGTFRIENPTREELRGGTATVTHDHVTLDYTDAHGPAQIVFDVVGRFPAER